MHLPTTSTTIALTLALASSALAADPGKLTVHADQPGPKISPLLYGIMTEEINHSYDGGLYAELIQNRTFQDDPKSPVHWSLLPGNRGDGKATFSGVVPATSPTIRLGPGNLATPPAAKISLDAANPLNAALPISLRLDIADNPQSLRYAIANDGFWGIPVQPNATYQASLFARGDNGFTGPLEINIESDAGLTVAFGRIDHIDNTWKHYTATLKVVDVTAPSTTNRLVILSSGAVNLNLVSLMPATFNNRPNGNRIDLMNLMADLRPAFLRLPGGNYLEGNSIAERFDWKQTLGPLENRPGHMAPWTYRSSDGMGLLEFLNWCEDIKSEPVLAVFAGYALKGEVVTGDALKPHIQDALDEIEYVTGDASTKWGAVRAKNGHPAPFKLTYVEIGNEDWFDKSNSYDARFTAFYDAIKARYPNLQLIATTPVRTRKADVLDDHYYRSAAAMQNDVHHYDKISRSGPRIFVGEWATTEGSPTPTMNAALGDAAWLTGMERNSDLIVMSCYAPLFVNVNKDASQWGTNLIGYDALKSFASPSYYVQRMFNQNRGDVVLPVELTPQIAKSVVEVPAPHGAIGAATWATGAQYKDMVVTTPDGKTLYQSDFTQAGEVTSPAYGWKTANGDWKADQGALQQTGAATEARAFTGDPAWGDLNYSLKAKKVSGNEGFMVMFNVQDANNYMWFNVGGWTNTRTAIELAENGARRVIGNESTFKVESDRWYDVRIEVRGKTTTCFIDGKQICAATFAPLPQPDSMYATASRDDATGDIILKVVNIAPTAQQMDLTLQGTTTINPAATAEVISGDPASVNTLLEPEKITPRRATLSNAAPKFPHEFPPHSVTVLRFKTK